MSERYIRDYLAKYGTVPAPTTVEEERPFSAVDVEAPNWKSPASAARHNKNEAAFYDDYEFLLEKLKTLSDSIEMRHLTSSSYLQGLYGRLAETDMLFSRVLLLLGLQDQFLYGVEENFSSHSYVDLTRTTAKVESDYVSLGRSTYTPIDLSRVTLTASATGDVKATRPSGQLSNLKELNGSGWDFYITGGKAAAVIHIDLNRKMYVGEVRLTSTSPGESYWSVSVSKDGETYTEARKGELARGQNSLSVGEEDVRKIKLMIYNKENIHSFTRLEIYKDKFSGVSTLYLGPYEIKDELGNSVNYTQATLDACLSAPPRTSVSFWLSKDGQAWSEAQGTVNLARTTDSNPTYISSDVIQEGLITEGFDLVFGKEALLNRYIDKDFSSLLVKRNLPQEGISLYGTTSGWFYDGEYSCAFYVSSPEGMILQFGDTSAILNGQRISGEVHVPQGYHRFRTSSVNWKDVPTGIKSEGQLRVEDPLYPRNHKLMIEGYKYPTDFSGLQLYSGADEYFGSLLTEVAPEVFEDSGSDLGIFTVIDEKYIKVKLDPSDPSYQQERFQVDYLVRAESGSSLYVKAELRSYDDRYTPTVNRISIRVV